MKSQVLYLDAVILREEMNFNISVQGYVVLMCKQKV